MLRLDKMSIDMFDSKLSAIKKIEAHAYPWHMQSIQDIDSLEDLASYVEAKKVSAFVSDDFYIIATKDEVCDFAAIGALKLKDIFFIADMLCSHFGTRKFKMDARAKTSYRLIKFFERHGQLIVHSRKEWHWDDELMIELVVSCNKKGAAA